MTKFETIGVNRQFAHNLVLAYFNDNMEVNNHD